MSTLLSHPVWGMAFRPFYLLAALAGALSILAWSAGYNGTADLPAFFWHAHEMIWGYAGAIVVGFLLTAVASWTQQVPTRGKPLAVLTLLWLLARLSIYFPSGALLSGIFGTAFFAMAAACMALPVIRSRNQRNYIAVVALFLFGLTHALFHLYLANGNDVGLRSGLWAGLVMVAGFIGLVGMRIVPFFTAKRLGTPQVTTPLWLMSAVLVLPMAMAILLLLNIGQLWVALFGIIAGSINLVQVFRWWCRDVAKEPMLWILLAGYASTALGLIVMGIAAWQPLYLSLGIHLIGVGGIGLMTLGMMTRTALGHTGQALYPAPKLVPLAFYLMIAAAVVRAISAMLMSVNASAYLHSYRLSGLLFSLALLLFLWRYTPWLLRRRFDGKPG